MDTSELLAFSEHQQAAIIGHALQSPKIFDMLAEVGVDSKWFTNVLGDLFGQIMEFKKTFNRIPVSVDEIVDFVIDELQKGATKRAVEQCVNAKKRHPWDTLEKKLVGWAKSRLIFVSTKEIVEKFNAGKHDDAYVLCQKNAVELQKIESLIGLEPDGFISSAQRVKGEAVRRAKDTEKTIPYALTYLQDMTLGMLPTDIVLWGATSGAGKTEAVKIQAAFTAKTLKEPVHYFALEAEPDEIERRIKYSLLAQHYKDDHSAIPRGMICYKNFRKNRLIEEFSPYEAAVEAQFTEDYSTLNTYYRTRGDFGIEQLEREMWALKGKSRLIVLDHIHFLDLGENETKELTYLIKQIRSMSQILEIPIILVAHITEKGIKHRELIPQREQFYGASNLFKTCTTAIMMAPCFGLVSADSRAIGAPTFIRVVKGRLENSQQYYPGIAFFNTYLSDYTEYYSVGRLEKGNTKWSSIKGDLPIWVDCDLNIVDVSDVE